MRSFIFGGLLAVAIAGAAGAQDKPADWARVPDGKTMTDFYPDEALDRSVSAKVRLRCLVRLDTTLHGCTVEEELPIGMGFGEATVAMAHREFRMKPPIKDGKAVEDAEIHIPVQWSAPSNNVRGVIFKAIWDEAPSFADVEAAWPAEAGDLPEGRGVIRCRALSTGRLTNCIVAGQTPKGSPFGGAARTLADKFRVRLTPEQAKEYTVADLTISVRFFNPNTPAGKARKVTDPEWIRQIDPEQIVALYPAAAADKGVTSGVGVADCLVAPDGKLTDCKVARESPEGLGFGPSAVAVAGVTQMNPWTADGRPAHGVRLKLPIKFDLAPEAEAPAAN